MLYKLKNLKTKKSALIATILLLVILIGSTFAYFQAQGDRNASNPLNVTTSTTDLLTFKVERDISVTADMTNFAEGAGNVSDSTTATAILRANNATNHAEARYNIYFVIDSNELTYTTEEHKPELLLRVTDPKGNEVTNITGLVHTENGFDITTRTGGFLIVADYEITSDATIEEQTWNIEVELVNLDSNQNKNGGKTLSGKIYVTKEQLSSYELMKINNINTTTTYNSIDTTLEYTKGTAEVDKYYFASEEVSSSTRMKTRAVDTKKLDFKESDTPSYKFDSLKENTTYRIYSYGKDKNGFKSNVYETEVTTNEFVAPKITNVSHIKTLNSITVTVDAEKGSNEISKYYYSKDDGETYTEGSNTYTFDGLNDTTEYKIKIKVEDTKGNYSTEYYEAIETEVYILPVVSSISSTTTYNSITITPTGSGEMASISKYQYSINDGEWQDSNTFNSLSEKTDYTIRVKAIDTNGRESNPPYETIIKTDAYKVPSVKNVTTSSDASTITVNVTGEAGDGTIKQYCYSRDNLDYVCNDSTSTTNSHTFSGLTSNTSHTIKVKIIDSNSRESEVYNTSESTVLIIPISEACQNQAFGKCIADNYLSDTNIYYHSTSLANGAEDNSYRYAGAYEDVENYVCFGSNTSPCPNENLYRIIGVFNNQIKLIKYDYAKAATLGTGGDYDTTYNLSDHVNKGENLKSDIGRYYWNYSNGFGSPNTWSASRLNKTNLNTTFLNGLGTTWSSKIATTSWKVAGNISNYILKNAASSYKYEIKNPSATTTYSAKIGLMYVSDYYYAASPTYWTYKGYDTATTDYRAAVDKNWMYMGLLEFTITRDSQNASGVFVINASGGITVNSLSSAIRPCFYLNSTVKLSSGTGTKTDPYRIS